MVNRHNPEITEINPLSPFSVGNGEFAFTADVTGLQTFPELYYDVIPLGTLANWVWHTVPPGEPFVLEDTFQFFDTYGREVPYASQTRSAAGRCWVE